MINSMFAPMVVLGSLLASVSVSGADAVQTVALFEESAESQILSKTGGATESTPFAIASIGKMMTSVAILRYAERDLMPLDAPVADWVSDDVRRGLGGLKGIEIQHLLTMTSGLPDYLSNGYFSDALDDPDSAQTPLAALSYAYDLPMLFKPGQGSDYSNTNYVLLGLILEAASGKSYDQVIREEVLEPARLRHSFVFGTRPLPHSFPKGHEDGDHIRAYYEAPGFGDGGVIASASDLARFFNALFVEETLLTTDSLDKMLTPAHGSDYGMGVQIDEEIVGHSGGDLGFSSDARINLETGRIAIILSASADTDTDWSYEMVE